jgi:transposase InsO family protein
MASSWPQENSAVELGGVLSAPAAVKPWPGAYARHRQALRAVRRGHLAGLVPDQLYTMKRIQWLAPGLAWSCDATEYGAEGQQLIPVQDLSSRYRFRPLVVDRLDGRQIATHLESLFRRHGPPLFLKRDNDSPFNHRQVDEVLARFSVLPLNNGQHQCDRCRNWHPTQQIKAFIIHGFGQLPKTSINYASRRKIEAYLSLVKMPQW